ncbi:MAG: hypothetical protein A4E66_02405 [Syntrophus sp. PtaB.Bin001]|nr:MAG: hypothetical protein A4E66_02405 [Syntrophus sp. PtaB.Bin001]
MKIIRPTILLTFLLVLVIFWGCSVNRNVVPPVFGSSKWVEYETNIYGGNYSYSEETIEHRTKTVVQVWNRVVYSAEGRERYIQDMKDNGISTDGYENLSETHRLNEIDCKKGMYNIVSIVDYDRNGKILFSDSYKKSEWNNIRFGSMMDKLRKKVCK